MPLDGGPQHEPVAGHQHRADGWDAVPRAPFQRLVRASDLPRGEGLALPVVDRHRQSEPAHRGNASRRYGLERDAHHPRYSLDAPPARTGGPAMSILYGATQGVAALK